MPIAAFLPRHQAGADRQALERAVFARLVRLMGQAIAAAPTGALATTASSASDVGAIAEFLAEVGPVIAATEADPLAEALLEGAKAKFTIMREAGGVARAEEVAKLLGITRQAVDKRRRSKALLAVPSASGDWLYPRAQFGRDGRPLPHLPDVLRAFRIDDPWMQLDALLARDPNLGGRTAFAALSGGDVDAVIQSVRAFGDHGL
jgi:hypothetical protein